MADDASSEVPMEGTDAVKSPSNYSNERKVPQRRQQIVSKAAVKLIGKIAQFKQKNSKISLPDNHNIDDDESSALNVELDNCSANEPLIYTNEKTIPQQRQRNASKAALKSIGKIAQLEQKNNKKSSSYANIEDESLLEEWEASPFSTSVFIVIM